MATESFTNSNGTQLVAHSANWSIGNGLNTDFIIDTNAVRTPFDRGSALFALYSGSFANDQYAEGKIAQVGSDQQFLGVCVRASLGNAYGFVVDGDQYYLWRLVNFGGYTTLAQGSVTISAGDIVRLEASGTTLTAKKNGSTVTTITDSTFSSGAPGVAGFSFTTSGTYTLLDDWVGNDLNAAAPQYWQYDWPHQLHARR